MLNGLRNFFIAPAYERDPEREQDARTTHWVGVVLLFLAAFSIPFIFLLKSPVREFTLGATVFGFFVWLLTIYLVKRERLTTAKVIILAVNTLNLFGVVYAIGGLALSTIFTTLFLLSLANLLFPRRGVMIYGVLLLVITAILYLLETTGLAPEPAIENTAGSIFLMYVFTVVSVTGMLAIAAGNSRRNLDATHRDEIELRKKNLELEQFRIYLEDRVAERTTELEKRAKQLETIASVARSTASVQDLEELLQVTTKLVSERFGYYHTGIFLLDENREFALLRAANSEGGQKMLARQHKLRLDINSIVGYATSRGEPRIALDVGADVVYFNNPDLPNTRSEMALPLRIGSSVIGTLDVQSLEPNAFVQEDIAILTTLADQLAIAIENARLFSEARNALKESEETFGRYVRQEWGRFAQRAKSPGYLFDGKRTIPLEQIDKQEKIRSLPQTGRLTLEKQNKDLVIPIRFRGQTLGYLDVRSKTGNRKWTKDDLALLESAAERAALALENARLVESAQRRAERERTIGEISTRIGAVSDLEAIMQTTVEELGRRIGGATEVTFEVENE